VKAEGQKALTKVAQVLNGVSDRAFLVAGHTDNVPIKTARYPSNWELSTERAVNVVQLLIKKGGMSPKVLSAAGYSEHDPVVPNTDEKNRAQNRRIEIVLQPNLSDLPSLDDLR
jgi:chemotaxis protein MotB